MKPVYWHLFFGIGLAGLILDQIQPGEGWKLGALAGAFIIAGIIAPNKEEENADGSKQAKVPPTQKPENFSEKQPQAPPKENRSSTAEGKEREKEFENLNLLPKQKLALVKSLLETMVIIATIDGQVGEKELAVLKTFSHRIIGEILPEGFEFQSLISEVVLGVKNMPKGDRFGQAIVNGHQFRKSFSVEFNKFLVSEIEKMILADGKVTNLEDTLFFLLKKTILPEDDSKKDKKIVKKDNKKSRETKQKTGDNHEGYLHEGIMLLGLYSFSYYAVVYAKNGYFFIPAVLTTLFAIVDKFFRRRCPRCRTQKVGLFKEEEIDRWLGTKELSEELGNGKTRTRNLQTTFVKIKRYYSCNLCDATWAEISNEEKKI